MLTEPPAMCTCIMHVCTCVILSVLILDVFCVYAVLDPWPAEASQHSCRTY